MIEYDRYLRSQIFVYHFIELGYFEWSDIVYPNRKNNTQDGGKGLNFSKTSKFSTERWTIPYFVLIIDILGK